MFTDIGKLEHVRIYPGLLEGLLEKMFVGTGGAGCDNQTVKAMFPDGITDDFL